MALSKPVSAASGPNALGASAGSDCATLFPCLWEYVVSAQWEDGTPRVTASLLLFAEDGWFKLCLNDRACDRSAWASGVTPEAAFSSLEGQLAAGSVEWRRKAPGTKKR